MKHITDSYINFQVTSVLVKHRGPCGGRGPQNKRLVAHQGLGQGLGEVAELQDESRFQWVIKPRAGNTLTDFL